MLRIYNLKVLGREGRGRVAPALSHWLGKNSYRAHNNNGQIDVASACHGKAEAGFAASLSSKREPLHVHGHCRGFCPCERRSNRGRLRCA